jgi:hypothetical protein
VIAVNAGCYSTPKTLEFHYVPEFGGGAFLAPTGVSDHREQKIMVPCTTIDIFVRERGIDALDLVKIDVEGAEEDVIAGASATLRKHHPVLLVEFNLAVSEKFFGRGLEPLHASIASLGYDLFLVNRLDDGIWPVTDYAALMARIDAQGGVGDVLCRPTVAR